MNNDDSNNKLVNNKNQHSLLTLNLQKYWKTTPLLPLSRLKHNSHRLIIIAIENNVKPADRTTLIE